jgi:hypothetical protein
MNAELWEVEMLPYWVVLVMLALVLFAGKLKSIHLHFGDDEPARRKLGGGRKKQKRLED